MSWSKGHLTSGKLSGSTTQPTTRLSGVKTGQQMVPHKWLSYLFLNCGHGGWLSLLVITCIPVTTVFCLLNLGSKQHFLHKAISDTAAHRNFICMVEPSRNTWLKSVMCSTSCSKQELHWQGFRWSLKFDCPYHFIGDDWDWTDPKVTSKQLTTPFNIGFWLKGLHWFSSVTNQLDLPPHFLVIWAGCQPIRNAPTNYLAVSSEQLCTHSKTTGRIGHTSVHIHPS